MNPILLSLFACIGWGVSDFVGGLKSRQLPVLAVMMIANPFGLLIMGLIILGRGLPLPLSPTMTWAVLSGFCGVAALFLLYKGLSLGSMSIVAPISGTGVILPVLVGLVKGDHLTPLQVVGILAAITGTFFAAREKKDEGTQPHTANGLNYAVASALFVGLYFVFMDQASEVDAYWASFLMRLSYGLILVPILFLTRTSLRGATPHLLPIAAMGIVDSLAGFTFALATTRGMISVVSVVSALYPGATVLLSGLFLRERLQLSQTLGVILALVGIGLISAG